MEKYQAIIDSIKNHDIDKFSKLLKHTPEIANKSLEQGISLLQFAAYCRNQEALRLITKYKSSFTIFEYAILGNQEEVGTNSFCMCNR